MKTFRLPHLAAASLALVTGAQALQLSFSTTAPVPGANDVYQLTGSANDGTNVRDGGTYADGGANDGFTYVAGDRQAQGQTFTTGSHGGGYALSTIWVRHAGYTTNTQQTYWNLSGSGSPLTLRVTNPAQAGTAGFALATETYTFSGSEANGPTPRTGNTLQGTGEWMRFDLATPVILQPGTVYGFDLQFFGGSIRYFELLGTQDANASTSGNAYRGGTVGASDNALQALTGDRAFLVGLTPLGSAPVFGDQPDPVDGFVGSPVMLQAVAASDPAPTYQWQRSANGVNGWTDVDGATTGTLEIPFAVYADRGFYRVVATNTNGSVPSNVVEVDLEYPAPAISQQPASLIVETGASPSLSVAATGLGNLSYQWFKGTDPISGETTDTLSFPNIAESKEGSYHVRITDDAATADSLPAKTTDSNVVTVDVFPTPSGLISHDPFSIAAGYVAGELPTQNPSITGYLGAWTDIDFGDAEPAISTGSLAYADPLYLGSSGDKVTVATDTNGGDITPANSGRVFRILDGPASATASTSGTRYLSFLFQSGQETGATIYQMLSLYNGDTADINRSFDIGLTNNGGLTGSEYDFSAGGTYVSTGVAANTAVHLLVVKFELSSASAADKVTVWVDPALGSGDPAGGATLTGLNLLWDRLTFSDYDGNSAAWDEVRWGSSFDSVTLNPNPGNTYATWIAGYPGVGSQTGVNDDPDKDGLANGVENYLGTDPTKPGLGLGQLARSGSNLSFQHSINPSPATNLNAVYQWSTDLVDWHDSGVASGGTMVSFSAIPNTPSAGISTVTASLTGTAQAKLFARLRVTQSP